MFTVSQRLRRVAAWGSRARGHGRASLSKRGEVGQRAAPCPAPRDRAARREFGSTTDGRLFGVLVAAAMGIAGPCAAGPPGLVGTPPWLETPKGWQAVLAPPNEPGGHFVLEGRLLQADGKTGMPGVTMFAYHADQNGLY